MTTELEAYILIVRSSGGPVRPSVTVWTDPHAIADARDRVASFKEQLGTLSGANSLIIKSGAKALKGELWLKPLRP
jgi:hypothetical protein